ENEHRHPGERRDRHQRAGERKEEVFDRPEAAHEDAERQGDRDREREPDQHAVHGVGGVLQHRAVEDERPERARDLRQRRQQRPGGTGAAAPNRLVAGGGEEEREARAVGRRRALDPGGGGGGHDITPQRTTVYCSSRWNTSFSSASPMAPMMATPASITSVFKNSRAPKIIQPSPHDTAASISTPTRMRQAWAKPSRNPVRT